jgi:hypothetical protein
MLTWIYEESILTSANAEQVWALWSRPHEWNRWDEAVEWVTLDGPFETGSCGRLKPVSGPAVKFVILEVQQKRGFTNRSFLPMTCMDFIHTYRPAESPEQGAMITVRIEMRGWLSPLFGRLIGRGIQKTLRESLVKCSTLAEISE